MRRRVLLTCLSLPLVAACASVLGDFDVEPKGATTTDGGGVDGSSTDGGATDGASIDSGTPNEPEGIAVATALNATCATVKYPSAKLVTYCWGETAVKQFAALGATATDQTYTASNGGVFYRPRLPIDTTITYLAFDKLVGGASGDWFLGHNAVGNASSYAWGTNQNDECGYPASAPSIPAASLPNELKSSGVSLSADKLFAAPGTGCVISGNTVSCWGHNDNCQVTTGAKNSCPDPVRGPTSEGDQYIGVSGQAMVIDNVAGGVAHTCATKHPANATMGKQVQVVCWGDNQRGQTGAKPVGVFTDLPTQVSNATANDANYILSSGENHTCFLDSAGLNANIYCWGRNDSGQCTPNAPTPSPAPAGNPITLPNQLAKSGTFSHLTLGGDTSCIVYNQVGSKPSKAYCWGGGTAGNGPLGGTVAQGIALVGNIQEVTALAVGKYQACAVARSNNATTEKPSIWCWGTNPANQTNPAGKTTDNYATPVQIVFPPEPSN